MPKPKYILESPDVPNPLKGKGGKGDAISVYDDADLKRRTDAANTAGVKVNVRKLRG
ncbi:MAG: hypothetical protein ACRDP6_29190 [Actinoallomurus sp.]